MKSVLYARVSSKEQEQEGFSIPAQLKLLNDYALKNSYKVVKEFVDVETAKRAGRENFNRMIEFLKKNTDIRAILCEKTDRLSRNFRDIATLDDLVNQHNLKIILVKENTIIDKNSKSHEKFIFGIKALMAKNYIDNLSEETKKGMIEKALEGYYPSSAPLGYKNIEIKKDGKVTRAIEIDQERAPIIQKLFRLYATGEYSLKILAKIAYKEGLRSRYAKRVGTSSIDRILKNPVYYGYFKWAGYLYKGKYPPLVSKELFDIVQEVSKRYNKPQKAVKKKFAYRGLLTCAKCGCAITAEIHKGKYVYYHCTGFKECENKKNYVREEVLDDKFAEIVRNIYIPEKLLELVKESLLESHKEELEYHQNKTQTLKNQKKKLKERLHKLYIDKLDGKINEDMYDELSWQWEKEIEDINEALERHERADFNYLSRGIYILELANKAYSLYKKRNRLERAKLLNILLSNCLLDGENLYPVYRKPFDLLAKQATYPNWGG